MGAMTSATAPVAAEIIARRPPTMEIVTAMVNEAKRPMAGSTPAMIENEIASGISASATTRPPRTSVRQTFGSDSQSGFRPRRTAAGVMTEEDKVVSTCRARAVPPSGPGRAVQTRRGRAGTPRTAPTGRKSKGGTKRGAGPGASRPGTKSYGGQAAAVSTLGSRTHTPARIGSSSGRHRPGTARARQLGRPTVTTLP